MKIAIATTALLMAIVSVNSHAGSYCGELTNAYGPFDYRKSEFAPNLHLVEIAHFTPEVEKLIKGNTGTLGGDLDYTLRAFPNHPRALASLARLALRSKGPITSGLKYSFECYFNRAVRFQPDDPAVHMIYGGYLSKRGKTDEALEHLIEAARLDPESGTANYNLGLLYFEKKDYETAQKFAKKAYALGFPLPGLKNKLIGIGRWTEEPERQAKQY